jgi:hypothetical protein
MLFPRGQCHCGLAFGILLEAAKQKFREGKFIGTDSEYNTI